MILTIDIGNSSIVTGIFRENELETLFRMAKATEKTSDEYGMLLYSFFFNIRTILFQMWKALFFHRLCQV